MKIVQLSDSEPSSPFPINVSQNRGNDTPTSSPELLNKNRVSNGSEHGVLKPTLLPPSHLLTQPVTECDKVIQHQEESKVYIDPSMDPLFAFEAAMRKLDDKKARAKKKYLSPPKAYRESRSKSSSSSKDDFKYK